ncbi:hypothetical protein DVH24_036677 [Malus domestica]|uniref:Uncharacterized protein n=1 Tax=Malus domestica TaxID=3750 RepID=A0A498IG41_MALDO|nr:hypothetical protein DVH24_036677 [Malus domestica]
MWKSSNKSEPIVDEDKESNSSPLSVLTYAAAPQLTLSKIKSSRSLPVIVAVRHGRTKSDTPKMVKKRKDEASDKPATED